MKLLYTVILLLAVAQLVLTQTFEPLTISPALLTKNQLLQFFADEINILSMKTCAQFYTLSEEILRDEIIKQAKTPLIQEFKANITRFQETYPIYKRYGLNKQLLLMFYYTTMNYYYQDQSANKDSQYILQLIRKLGYDQVVDQFESNFTEFATKKFLPKIEEFKNQLSNNETIKWQKLFKWADEMKACKVYACFYNYFRVFNKIVLTPRQHISAYITQQLKELNIFYANSTLHICRGVLKNKKLPQLSPNVQKLLTNNINDYIIKYENANDISQLHNLLVNFYENVLLRFYNNSDIPINERQLLVKIFNEAGYAQFLPNYYKKFNNFIERGVIKRVEYYRASFSQEQLFEEKQWLDYLDRLKSLTSYEERISLLKDLPNIKG